MFFTFLRCSVRGLCVGLTMTLAVQAQAGIVLNTTRVIYPAEDKEVGLIVHNTGASDILAQSWLESGIDGSSSSELPFVVTPSLARMAGDARQVIRIIYSGEGMATDRESVLWLNVQEIPQSARDNELQIAVRQRIKLFYRPRNLPGDPLEAAQTLQWQVQGDHLVVSNPGPYHVSMVKLVARQRGQVVFEEGNRMLTPSSQLKLPLRVMKNAGALDLAFISINDFGAQEPYRVSVTAERATQASKAEADPD